MVADPTSRQEEARPLPTERLKMVTRELVCIDKTPEAGPVSLDNLKKQTPLPKMAGKYFSARSLITSVVVDLVDVFYSFEE